MSLSTKATQTLTNASAKALATAGPHGINLVPVSMIKVNSDSVWLFDFFMDKTVGNIESDPSVSLTAWTDMIGIQVKANATYLNEGPEFTEAVNWVKTQNPDRVTKGLLLLKPTAVFDISPSKIFSEEDLEVNKHNEV